MGWCLEARDAGSSGSAGNDTLILFEIGTHDRNRAGITSSIQSISLVSGVSGVREAAVSVQGRVLGASVLVGIVAGIGGILFSVVGQAMSIHARRGRGLSCDGPDGEVHFPWIPSFNAPFNPWLLLVVPAFGGLLSGLLVYRFSPEAEGHGTDAAIAAYHEHQGYIRPRVPLVKLLASASRSAREDRAAVKGRLPRSAPGSGRCSGGYCGFGRPSGECCWRPGWVPASRRSSAPLAGTLFAAEIMYCSPEFESEVILPTGLASVVSYCTFGVLAVWLGGTTTPWRPLFTTGNSLLFSGALGALAVFGSGDLDGGAGDDLRALVLCDPSCL